MKYVFFDIETGSNPNAEQFVDPPDWNDIKTMHKKVPAEIEKEKKEKLGEWWAKAKEKFALDALTAQILVIGILEYDDVTGEIKKQQVCIEEGRVEEDLLNWFWNKYYHWMLHNYTIVGHYCKDFDIPMLIRRSWANGVVPYEYNRRDGQILDLRDMYAVGEWQPDIKLTRLCQMLGISAGEGKVQSKHFEKWFMKDRQLALDHNKNHVEETFKCWKVLSNYRKVEIKKSDLLEEVADAVRPENIP